MRFLLKLTEKINAVVLYSTSTYFYRIFVCLVVFSIPSILLIYFGYSYEAYGILKYFGIGILLYGIAYLIFHDIIVHRRIKTKFKAKSSYMKRIMNAHYVHHKVHTKQGAKAFGFLFAPKKYDVKSD